MFVAMLMATAMSPGPNAVSLSASGGLALTTSTDSEGNALGTGTVSGARLQYDRALAEGWFVGPVAGFEHFTPRDESASSPKANAFQLGLALGVRWGHDVRGGLRVASGYAHGMATLPAKGTVAERHLTTPGWFLDFEGELAMPIDANWELFLDIPIVLSRTFTYRGSDAPPGKWWYAVPIVPVMGTLGLRHVF